jgi:putative ABC transport system permease protein
MIRFSLRQLWLQQRRLAGTLLAVVLGVAFLMGTLVLGDTLRSNFERLFTQTNAGTDVVLRSATKVGTLGVRDLRAGIPASLAQRVRGIEGGRGRAAVCRGVRSARGRGRHRHWRQRPTD